MSDLTVSNLVKNMSFEEFLKYEKENEGYFEYDGLKPIRLDAPNVDHQEVSIRLSNILFNFFEDSTCRAFTAPFPLMFDYEVKGGKGKQKHPDLLVICDNEVFNGKYYGVPLLIIEILSPNNFQDDLTIKKNLYEKLGVLEYITVNMYLKEVRVYNLDIDEKRYKEPIIYKDKDICNSEIFDDLRIDLSKTFKDIIVRDEDVRQFKSKVIKVDFRK